MRWKLLIAFLTLGGCDRATTVTAEPVAPSASTPAPQPVWPDTELAQSTSTAGLPADAITVVLSRTALLLGPDRKRVAALPAPEQRTMGFGRELKRSPAHLEILPLTVEMKTTEMKALVGLPGALQRKFVLAIDKSTPFRLLAEVLYTLGKSGVGGFDLAVRNGDRTTVNPLSLPSSASSPGVPVGGLHLLVLLSNNGIVLKTLGGNVGPGCEGTLPGLALPLQGGAYDFAGLRACAQKLKRQTPEAAAERTVSIQPGLDIDFQTIVATMDALRNTDAGEALLPDVQLRVAF